MDNNIQFAIEGSGYMKEQVDKYILVLANAYRQLTEVNEGLQKEVSKGKFDMQQLMERVQTFGKQYSKELSLKNSMINDLTKEKAMLLEEIEKKNNDIKALKSQAVIQPRAAVQPADGGVKKTEHYSEVIAQMMYDVEVFATNVKEQAKKDADIIVHQAKKDVFEYDNYKKHLINQLKDMHILLSDFIQKAESQTPDGWMKNG